MTTTSRVWFAHNLRVLAIALVIAAHFAGLFWQRPEIIHVVLGLPAATDTHGGAMLTAARGLHYFSQIDCGAVGVALFFLVSGFVIPFSLERFRRGPFAVARFFRIYPTYWAALLLSVLALYGCRRYFHADPELDFGRIVKQLLLVRDWFWLPPLDVVSWSLEIEIKFYLLALLIAGWLREGRIVHLLLAALALAGLSLLAGVSDDGEVLQWTKVLQYDLPAILFMFCGVMLNLQYRRKIEPGLAVTGIGWCLALTALTVWKSEVMGPFFATTMINYLLALLIFGVAYYYRRYALTNRGFNFLADISYPLYGIHAVCGFAVMEILLARGWSSVAAAGLALVLVLLLATILHFLVELPATRYGKKLAAKILPPPL